MTNKLKKGFTLIEIMVSILIIGILSSIFILNKYEESKRMADFAGLKTKWSVNEGKYIENLAGKWSFDEGSGTSTQDGSNFDNTGTITGSPTWKDSKDCISGTCLDLDGSNQYVSGSIPTFLLSGSSAKTITAWIYPDNSDPGGTIASLNNTADSAQSFILEMVTNSSSVYLFTNGFNSDNDVIISGAEIPTLSTWNYVVFAFDGTDWKYYLNGVLTKSGTFTPTLNTSPNSISIGSRMDGSTTGYWPGLIDEVAVYSGEVKISQIESEYLAGLDNLLNDGTIGKDEYNQRVAELEKNNKLAEYKK
jgi:prepilin-type N-terminal cleavage/methylation domain-containing protein